MNRLLTSNLARAIIQQRITSQERAGFRYLEYILE